MTADKQADEREPDAKSAGLDSQPGAAPLGAGRSIVHTVMALQRLAGNRAVSRALDRPEIGSGGHRPFDRLGVALARRRLDREVSDPPVDKWAGTLVDYVVISSTSGRAMFHTASGDEIPGTAKTDLKPGAYTVKPDSQHADRAKGETMRWVFDPGQVTTGVRFEVTLEGALPETLVYPDTISVIVTVGLTKVDLQRLIAKLHGLLGTKDTAAGASKTFNIDEFIASGFTGGHPYDQDFKDGCRLLQSLNEADLVDVLAGSSPDVIQNLLVNFNKALAEGLADDQLLTVLDRLEWKDKAADKLYVDNFTSFAVDQKSFSRDPEREKKGLWNIQIVFYYGGLTPERAIKVYYDDILDADAMPPAFRQVGMWGLIYPAVLTKATVPRMWDAKRKVRDQIETANFDFIFTAFQATQMVLDLVMLGSGFLMRTIPSATTGRISTSGYRGPFGTGGRVPQEIYPYVNRNPGASTPEVRLGTELDRLAQTRRLGGDVARVYGAPESNVRGVRSGDYRFVKVDGTQIRADAIHPITEDTNTIYGRIMQKSGTQADVVVVELSEGRSVNVSIADAKATADSAIAASRSSNLSLQRVIFVKNGQIVVDVAK